MQHLILHDMDIHRVRADSINSFSLLKDAPTLLLAGVAEINSNANMFGGYESESFKIKMKRLEKYGDKICRRLFDGKDESNV